MVVGCLHCRGEVEVVFGVVFVVRGGRCGLVHGGVSLVGGCDLVCFGSEACAVEAGGWGTAVVRGSCVRV